ncbi:MAG: hypothetical protein H0T46_18470 [Deltaproteobacteria bacterium]|nr:hypothetical protein [Deltaproteobacteria bacterium]
MMVEIVGVDATGVEVTSPVGPFRAGWHGAPPPIGARRDVEFSFHAHQFTWGVDAVAIDEQPHAIEPGANDDYVLWARIEQLEDGGGLVLRFGPSIVLTGADGDPPPVGSMVRLEVPSITLYDTNI